jgi:hypothetical protein
MPRVWVKQETHYRGFHIEGLKQGEGMLLRVTRTRPCLPTLTYSRFRTLRGSWASAVDVVAGYIDEVLSTDQQSTRWRLNRDAGEWSKGQASPGERLRLRPTAATPLARRATRGGFL